VDVEGFRINASLLSKAEVEQLSKDSRMGGKYDVSVLFLFACFPREGARAEIGS
jgi:hypothetical protein